MVLQGYVTKKNHYISITWVPMASRLGRMIIFFDRLLPIMSHDSLIMWPCEILGSLIVRGSARERLSCYRLLLWNWFCLNNSFINRSRHGCHRLQTLVIKTAGGRWSVFSQLLHSQKSMHDLQRHTDQKNNAQNNSNIQRYLENWYVW